MKMYTKEMVKENAVNVEGLENLVFTSGNPGMSWKDFNYNLNCGSLAVVKDGEDLVLVREVGFMYEEMAIVDISTEEDLDTARDMKGINYILDMMEAAISEPELQGDYEYWKGEADAWLDYYGAFCDVSEAAERFAQISEREDIESMSEDQVEKIGLLANKIYSVLNYVYDRSFRERSLDNISRMVKRLDEYTHVSLNKDTVLKYCKQYLATLDPKDVDNEPYFCIYGDYINFIEHKNKIDINEIEAVMKALVE
jgi:hypothetical protein